MTTERFEQIVIRWIATARHPRWHRPYTDLVYQPMQELLRHLRESNFQVYIVSSGGIEFMRPWVERVYGVPRSHVIGSSIKTELARRRGEPVLMRRPEIEFVAAQVAAPWAWSSRPGPRLPPAASRRI